MIHGFFIPDTPYPLVRAAVNIPYLTENRWVAVTFLVDTGASRTCLHPRDAIDHFKIDESRLADPTQWRRMPIAGGVGGAAAYFPLPVRYGFVHADGREEIVEGTIAVGQLTATNQWIPSLMGWDLLQYFRMDLHGRDKTLTLDRV